MIYGAQAQRVSEGIGSSTEEAEHVIKKYFRKFGGLKRWLADMADVSKYQNWVEDCLGRKYFVGESNAKGSADSAVRKGPNAIVQGIGASMTKMGVKYTEIAYQKINDKRRSLNPSALEAQIVGVIHDEVVSYVPGGYKLIDCVEKNGFYSPVYEYDDLSKEYAKVKQDAMELAMTEILSPLLEKTKWSGQNFPSKAEAMVGRRWSVK